MARKKIDTICQTRTVEDYCGRFQRLYNILSSELNAGQAIFLFTKGLRADIARDVDIRDPQTLVEAMSLAQRLESSGRGASRAVRPPFRPSFQQRSFPSHSSSHSSSAPMELGQLDGEYSEQEEDGTGEMEPEDQLYAAQSQREPSFRRAPPRHVKRLDDATWKKRTEDNVCYECGKAGHYGRDCPLRKRAASGAATKPKNA